MTRRSLRSRNDQSITEKRLREVHSWHFREKVLERCLTQEWPGVEVQEQCGNRGRGVVATRKFQEGQIILDFHGHRIPVKDGGQLMASGDISNRRSDYILWNSANAIEKLGPSADN